MSEFTGDFVRGLIQEGDSLTDPENCRNAAQRIKDEINKRFPEVKVSFLAYPEVREGPGVHYAVLVKSGGKKILINTVRSPGFPLYIGDMDLAVPTFAAMKETDTVK